MPVITFSTAGAGVPPAAAAAFAAKVAAVLADPRGWRKYGYHFNLLRGAEQTARNLHRGAEQTARNLLRGAEQIPNANLRFVLVPAAEAARRCGAAGFSCWLTAVPGAPVAPPGPGGPDGEIVVNLANWDGGSRSRLPLERYRTYVINHEVGHALGLAHQACPAAECARRGLASCPASVMMQMTRGPAHVAPCVEADWPLDPDWGLDDPAASPRPAGLVILAVLALAAALVAAVRAHRRRRKFN